MASSTFPDTELRAAFEDAYVDAAALQEQMFEVVDPDALATISNYFVASLVCPHPRVLVELILPFF
jgi:uncharacterized protein (UPF0333 family)